MATLLHEFQQYSSETPFDAPVELRSQVLNAMEEFATICCAVDNMTADWRGVQSDSCVEPFPNCPKPALLSSLRAVEATASEIEIQPTTASEIGGDSIESRASKIIEACQGVQINQIANALDAIGKELKAVDWYFRDIADFWLVYCSEDRREAWSDQSPLDIDFLLSFTITDFVCEGNAMMKKEPVAAEVSTTWNRVALRKVNRIIEWMEATRQHSPCFERLNLLCKGMAYLLSGHSFHENESPELKFSKILTQEEKNVLVEACSVFQRISVLRGKQEWLTAELALQQSLNSNDPTPWLQLEEVHREWYNKRMEQLKQVTAMSSVMTERVAMLFNEGENHLRNVVSTESTKLTSNARNSIESLKEAMDLKRGLEKGWRRILVLLHCWTRLFPAESELHSFIQMHQINAQKELDSVPRVIANKCIKLAKETSARASNAYDLAVQSILSDPQALWKEAVKLRQLELAFWTAASNQLKDHTKYSESWQCELHAAGKRATVCVLVSQAYLAKCVADLAENEDSEKARDLRQEEQASWDRVSEYMRNSPDFGSEVALRNWWVDNLAVASNSATFAASKLAKLGYHRCHELSMLAEKRIKTPGISTADTPNLLREVTNLREKEKVALAAWVLELKQGQSSQVRQLQSQWAANMNFAESEQRNLEVTMLWDAACFLRAEASLAESNASSSPPDAQPNLWDRAIELRRQEERSWHVVSEHIQKTIAAVLKKNDGEKTWWGSKKPYAANERNKAVAYLTLDMAKKAAAEAGCGSSDTTSPSTSSTSSQKSKAKKDAKMWNDVKTAFENGSRTAPEELKQWWQDKLTEAERWREAHPIK